MDAMPPKFPERRTQENSVRIFSEWCTFELGVRTENQADCLQTPVEGYVSAPLMHSGHYEVRRITQLISWKLLGECARVVRNCILRILLGYGHGEKHDIS